jgi:hypothetical protein
LYLDSGAHDSGAIILRTTGTGGSITERLRVNSTGNVGIGTSNPGVKLDIQGSVSTFNGVALALTNFNAGNTNPWVLGTGGRDVRKDAFSIGDSSSYKMTIFPNGFVGIGTITPGAALDVRGDIKLGTTGQYLATGGEENLRIIRGVFGETGNIIVGSGFTVSRTPPASGGVAQGDYTVTFSTAFSGAPAVTAVSDFGSSSLNDSFVQTFGATATSVRFFVRQLDGTLVDAPVHFIAIGPK